MSGIVIDEKSVDLDRDVFLRKLMRELAFCLEEVVGLEEASGLISIVAYRMGLEYTKMYKAAIPQKEITSTHVAQILVDLKKRIGGDFYVISATEESIVLGNRLCPFEAMVLNRPALCMMTTNVFGVIASQFLGYAKVSLEKTIAEGDEHCRVVLYLDPHDSDSNGKEFFRVMG